MNGVIWVDKSKISYDTVKDELRVRGQSHQGPIFFDCWYQNEMIGLPRYWAEKKGYSGNYSSTDADWGVFTGQYRPQQKQKLDDILKSLKTDPCMLFSAQTGFGKTLIGCAVAAELGKKALVIADQVNLLDQWEASASNFFQTPAGRLKGKKWNYTQPLTLTTIQTLNANLERLDEITGEFGITIFDEAHTFSTPSFHNVMPYLDSQYRLGVSATFRRADKLEKVWEHHLGKILVSTDRTDPNASYHSPHLEFPVDPSKYMIRGKLSHTHMVSAITEITEYNSWIVDIIEQAANKKRKLLIVSHRVNHLENLSKLLTARKISHRIYSGSDKHLNEARETGCILTTYSKFSKGVDAPELDTLFLLTPCADPEQVVGRVTRSYPGKQPAVVIDPRFDHPYLQALWRKRVRIYDSIGVKDAEAT